MHRTTTLVEANDEKLTVKRTVGLAKIWRYTCNSRASGKGKGKQKLGKEKKGSVSLHGKTDYGLESHLGRLGGDGPDPSITSSFTQTRKWWVKRREYRTQRRRLCHRQFRVHFRKGRQGKT